jgi:hypothetical protein
MISCRLGIAHKSRSKSSLFVLIYKTKKWKKFLQGKLEAGDNPVAFPAAE